MSYSLSTFFCCGFIWENFRLYSSDCFCFLMMWRPLTTNVFVCHNYNLYHSKEEKIALAVKGLHIIRKLIKVFKMVERRLRVNSTEGPFS